MTNPHSPIDINNEYTVTVRNKFDTLHETPERHTPNDEYESFVMETAEDCIPTKPKVKCKVPWESLVGNYKITLKNILSQ